MAKKRVDMEESMQEEYLEDKDVKEIGQNETLRFRYVGNTIMHFHHNDILYQLMPNTVYFNLPDCEPVKRMIDAKDLIPV